MYHRFCGTAPYTPKRMADGVEVGGLRMTTINPLKSCLIEYDQEGCSLSLTIEGTAPMADSVAMTMEEKDGGLKSHMHNAHLETGANVSGAITIRGEKTEIVGGYAYRDIAWGVRDWSGLYLYRLSWPVFTDGKIAGLIHAVAEGGVRTYMKMFYDGKKWLRVKEIEDNIEFAEDGMTVKSLHYRFWDENDKLWEYTGKPIFNYMVPLEGYVPSFNFMEYQLSDGTLGYGTCECGFRLPWDESYFTPAPKRKEID